MCNVVTDELPLATACRYCGGKWHCEGCCGLSTTDWADRPLAGSVTQLERVSQVDKDLLTEAVCLRSLENDLRNDTTILPVGAILFSRGEILDRFNDGRCERH